MATGPATEIDSSAARYEALIRISNSILAETMSGLTRDPWPGNIRELPTTGPVLTVRSEDLHALEKSSRIVAGPEGAAARLGLKRSAFQSSMQKLGIRISRTGA